MVLREVSLFPNAAGPAPSPSFPSYTPSADSEHNLRGIREKVKLECGLRGLENRHESRMHSIGPVSS